MAIHPEFLPQKGVSAVLVGSTEAPVKASVEALVDLALNETAVRILQICKLQPIGRKALVEQLGHKSLSGNVKKALNRLLAYGLIEYTIKNKPGSRLQKYKITDLGFGALQNEENGY